MRHLEVQGQTIARIVDLQPTSPLRDAQDITNALLARPEAALTLSVREAGDNPYFNLVEQGADGWVHLSKGMATRGARTRPRCTPSTARSTSGSAPRWRTQPHTVFGA